MSWSKIALFLLCEILVICLILPGSMAEKVIKEESTMISDSIGDESYQYVSAKGHAWKNYLFYDTGFYDSAYWMLIPTEEERQRSKGIEKLGTIWFEYAEGRLDALEDLLLLASTRTAQILIWVPAVLIILIPALTDGYMSRRIAQSTFEYASPIIHTYAKRFAGLVLLTAFILFMLPYPFNPMLIPIGMMLLVIPIGLALGNFQKRV